MFHGKGGYTWYDVYNMPIWLRRYTFKKMKEFYEQKDSNPAESNSTRKLPKGPNIDPSYTTKVSSK